MRRAIQVNGEKISSCADFQQDQNINDFVQYEMNHEIIYSGSESTADIVDKYYFPSNVLTLRPSMSCSVDVTTITADGVDEATISGIPNGAEAIINGDSQGTVTDDELIISSAVAKVFEVTIRLWPYLDWEETINAS